ncbi:Uncharacterised protein [uncultured archaeon]|nr:Uncharacterised protein [uncultured archaeon]
MIQEFISELNDEIGKRIKSGFFKKALKKGQEL